MIAELNERLDDYKTRAMERYPSEDAKREALARLRELWDRGIRTGVLNDDTKPSGLHDYIPLAPDEFYVCWVWGTVELDKEVVEPSIVKDFLTFAESDNIQPNRWVLCWHITDKDGAPHGVKSPYWLHIDEVVSKGVKDGPYTKVAVERNDTNEMKPPFELSQDIAKALRKVLRSGQFDDFLYKDEWSVNPTIEQLPDFLKALRAAALQGA